MVCRRELRREPPIASQAGWGLVDMVVVVAANISWQRTTDVLLRCIDLYEADFRLLVQGHGLVGCPGPTLCERSTLNFGFAIT